tara:strand:- start:435 stop:767 length:333 start_codon:yes stop_codon:yes gene_type:complete
MILAKIVTIEFTKIQSGGRAIKVVLKTTDNVWIRDYIGETAPSFVVDRYWSLLGISRGWAAFTSDDVWRLIGLNVEIKTEPGDYGDKVTDIRMVGAEPATIEPPDDDIPF